MKKVLSMVLTIAMLVTIFSTVLNLGAVSAAPNDYLKILARHHKPSSRPTKSVTPTSITTPTPTSITIPTPTPSTSEAFKISVENISGVQPGVEISIPVKFTNVPAIGISATDFKVSYDPTKLEYIGTSAGNIVKNPAVNFAANKSSDGTIKVLFLDFTQQYEYISTDGEFAYLIFKIRDSARGASYIKVYDATVADQNLNRVPTTVFEGLVNIPGSNVVTPYISPVTPITTPTPVAPTSTPTLTSSDLKVTLGSIDASPNENVTVPLSFTNVPDNGIVTFDMTIKYDPNCLEYLAYEYGDIVPNPDVNFCINQNEYGTLKLLFLDYTTEEFCIKSDGLVADLKFKVLNPSDKSTSIEISNPTFGDYDLNYVIPTVVMGTVNISGTPVSTPAPENEFEVKIGSQDANIGDMIIVPVNLTNVPVKGIAACDMTIAYNINQLEYVSCDTGIIVNNPDINFGINKPHDGILKLLFLDYTAESEYITSDGTFVNLTFKVLDSYSNSTSINMMDSNFCDIDINRVNATIVPGVINISGSLIPTPTPTNDFTVNVASVEGETGDLVRVPINFTNVPSTGMDTIEFTVCFDTTKLEYISSESKSTVPNLMLCKLPEGEIKIILTPISMESYQRVKEDGEIANIAFKILGSTSESAPIQIQDAFFTYFPEDNNYVNLIDASINSGMVNIIGSTLPTPTPTNTNLQINVGSVKGKTGDIVTVPVSFINVPESKISATDMTIEYDPAQLECVSIDAGNIVPNPELDFEKGNPCEGIIKLLYLADFANSSYINSDGVLANITFKILGSYYKFTPVSVFVPTVGNGDLLEVPVKTVSGGVDISGIGPNPDFNIGSTVSGYVYSDLGNPSVADFSFNEGFKVELAGSTFSTVTDSNGYFEIENVPVGIYKFNINKPNYLARQIENISVYADKELSTASSPIILWPGDLEINGTQDGAINLEDIMEICKAFNSVLGHDMYQENLDLNKDGAINLEDVMIVAKHFNKTSSDY